MSIFEQYQVTVLLATTKPLTGRNDAGSLVSTNISSLKEQNH